MNKIKWNRAFLGGLLAGLIINLSEFITNGVVLANQWEVAMKALGRSMSSSALISFAILGFMSGFAIVLLYAKLAMVCPASASVQSAWYRDGFS